MTISKSILKALHNTNCKGYLHYHGSPYAYLKKHLYWSDIKEKPINAIKIIIAKIFYPFKKRKLKQIIQQSSDGFVTVSNGVRLELKQLYKKDFPQVVTIHNPISYTEKTVVDLTTKENKIIFVSRLERKHKNAFLSIKAWQLIHEKYPDWEFQVLGDGRLFKEIKTFKKDNNITNLQLFGQVNNVNAYLEKSSISVLTSDCEGFGMGIFESIANKNAIVSTESDGGVKDLITDGFNGFIVPRNDIKQLSDKIEQLINDKELREKMANNSFERYQSLINENAFRQWKVLLNI
ncbi:MAG TPA: glycosyltransferase [Flavobacteriaceae bacterium]|nr:glycosyltransferase [Flavobacteriaceae bacterium]